MIMSEDEAIVFFEKCWFDWKKGNTVNFKNLLSNVITNDG